MSKNLMMRFVREMFAPNGMREMSSTSDVDAALSNAILAVLDGVQVSDQRQSAKPLAQFLKRSARDKLKIGAFNDIETFLRAMRSAKGGRRDDESTSFSDVNPEALPVLNLGRSPGFQPHDMTIMSAEYNAGALPDKHGNSIALLSVMPVEITYTLMVLANEKETLSALTAIYASWIYQYVAYGSTRFTASSQLAGSPIALECSFRDPKALIIEDLSGQLNNDRVYAAAIPITIVAPLYTAWLGTPQKTSFEVFNNGVAYTTAAPVILPPTFPNPYGEVV
jgi:hypothetical protein